MKFIFECYTRYKMNFISPSSHVLFYLFYKFRSVISKSEYSKGLIIRISGHTCLIRYQNTCVLIRHLRVSQGFWGTREHWQNIEGNKGILANFWKQGTTFRKITVRKHSERVWEHGNIGQFWKGTREQGPPLGDPHISQWPKSL